MITFIAGLPSIRVKFENNSLPRASLASLFFHGKSIHFPFLQLEKKKGHNWQTLAHDVKSSFPFIYLFFSFFDGYLPLTLLLEQENSLFKEKSN